MVNRIPILILWLLLLPAAAAVGQVQEHPPAAPADTNPPHATPKGHVAYYVLDDGDSVPVVNLPAIEVLESLSPVVVNNMKRYLKLKRDVIRAYPYAKLAAETLKQLSDTLNTIHRKKYRKRFLKESEAELKARFEKELKKLSINQGKILIKLINRETGDTSYEIVKDLRGTFNAFFWQTMARFFGSTMKAEYDPQGEDRLIEAIVQSIERGETPVEKK